MESCLSGIHGLKLFFKILHRLKMNLKRKKTRSLKRTRRKFWKMKTAEMKKTQERMTRRHLTRTR